MELISSLEHLSDLPMDVSADLPGGRMTVEELLSLEPGSTLRTERAAGEGLDIRVGGHRIAGAEMIVIENFLALRLSDFRERK